MTIESLKYEITHSDRLAQYLAIIDNLPGKFATFTESDINQLISDLAYIRERIRTENRAE